MNLLALIRTLRSAVATALVAALLVLAGHFLWPKAPDPRAVALEPRLTAFRGQVAALQHDTTRLAHTRDSLTALGDGTHARGRARLVQVVTVLDTSSVPALRAQAASLTTAVAQMDSSHTADSLALHTQQRITALDIARLVDAAYLIAQAQPIVHDAARPAKVWRWFAAGAGVAIVVLRVVR